MKTISRAIRNPWLLVFTGIPLLAAAWLSANWALPRGENYYGLFAAAVVVAVIGSVLLVAALYWGKGLVRLLAVLFLLANWPIAAAWMKVEPWRPRVVKFQIPPPKTSTITARPVFKDREGYTTLILADASRTFEVYQVSPPLSSLDPGKSYLFTIEETCHGSDCDEMDFAKNEVTLVTGHRDRQQTPDFYSLPEIMAVDHDGIRIFDRSVCEVHQQKMERRDVRISYGYPSPGAFPDIKTEAERFPHYRDFVLGGCCVTSGMPQTERKFICGECKTAYGKWQAEHPQPVK